MNERSLYLCHHGVLGMKWGVRRFQPYGYGYDPKHKGRYVGKQKKASATQNRTKQTKFQPLGKNDPILGIDQAHVNLAQNEIFNTFVVDNDDLYSDANLPTYQKYDVMTEEEYIDTLATYAEAMALILIDKYLSTYPYNKLRDGKRHAAHEYLQSSGLLAERVYADLGTVLKTNKTFIKYLKSDRGKSSIVKLVGDVLGGMYKHNQESTESFQDSLKKKARQKVDSDSNENSKVKIRKRGGGLNSGTAYRNDGSVSGALTTPRDKLKKQYPNLPDYAIDAMLNTGAAQIKKDTRLKYDDIIDLMMARKY